MKKIFTLIAATVLTVATFAADRRPTVTLKSSKNYEIVIDGRSYFSSTGIMDLSNMRRGQHTIKVYESGRRTGSILGGFGSIFFQKGKRLVDAETFVVANRDIDITIDFRGKIQVREDRFGRDRWDNDRDHRYDNDNDHGRDWDKRF